MRQYLFDRYFIELSESYKCYKMQSIPDTSHLLLSMPPHIASSIFPNRFLSGNGLDVLVRADFELEESVLYVYFSYRGVGQTHYADRIPLTEEQKLMIQLESL